MGAPPFDVTFAPRIALEVVIEVAVGEMRIGAVTKGTGIGVYVLEKVIIPPLVNVNDCAVLIFVYPA
ncbi:MAG: hypothetical protein A2658_00790 [Candidatus Yonathbacteria bacterium RIFCSPHIGHO2_01_FULL_44_19]|nr:MAG: hypothetical protein A2658_00790 [Candidatus Yonathbacteria bacterium RIFCSPHIGHO2_01_FULL_44_19]